MPHVSILFPVHSKNEFVDRAFKSLISQDFLDLEIIVVDSTEESFYSKLTDTDSRVQYIAVSAKSNLSMMLNKGIKSSKGVYIARMDSDDFSLPDRISKQVQFMNDNPETMVLGGGIRFIGDESAHKAIIGNELIISEYRDNYWEYLLYKNPLFHPTVMFRSLIFAEGNNYYNEKYERSQDLELWVRLSRNYSIRNLERIILEYRVHENQSGRLSPAKSRHFSILARIKHSTWIIFHDPSLRLRSAKNLLTLIFQFLANYPKFLFSK